MHQFFSGMTNWCMMALQKLFCVCLRVSVAFLPMYAPTSSAKVFSSSLALVLLFCWKAREHISSASHAHATPFLPLAMHFAHGNNYAILRVCYALRSKRSNINRLRHFQTVYNKHYVNKTPNLGKIERKNPPRPRLLVGVSVCNPTHILHLFLPPHAPIV